MHDNARQFSKDAYDAPARLVGAERLELPTFAL
jgi:hypothetical protein